MASITIGGKTLNVAPLTFHQLETAWPHFISAQEAGVDPMVATGHYLSFVSAILAKDYAEFESAVDLKKALLVSEIKGITASVTAILIENEMLTKPGEPTPVLAAEPAAAEPSPETAQASSANSSQPELKLDTP